RLPARHRASSPAADHWRPTRNSAQPRFAVHPKAPARGTRICAEPGAGLGVVASAVVEQLLPLTAFDEEARVLSHFRRGGVVRAIAQLEPVDAEAAVELVHEAPQGRRCQSGAPCGGDDPVAHPRARMPTFDPGGHDIADDPPIYFDDPRIGLDDEGEGACRPCRLGAVDLFDPRSGTIEAAVIGDVAGQV